MWNQCCFITSILKSLVIVAVWLALIGAIYSRLARLTINLQESEICFCNFTNQLNQWFTVTIISQLRWYGQSKANQQLDRDNYFLVHSGWNLKSTLLVIPPGFTTKTKNKEISKGSYNTSRDLPLRAWRLPIAQLYQIPLHTGGRITCWETVPQAAPRHTRARTESFLEWKSVESILLATLSSQSLWRQCHAMVSFSICHAIFIGFIEQYYSYCFAHAGKF